jgi:hypothetical protein
MPRPLPEHSDDVTIYLVLNDFGKLGSAYVEADRETIIRNFLSGQYGSAIRVVTFNTAERMRSESWKQAENLADRFCSPPAPCVAGVLDHLPPRGIDRGAVTGGIKRHLRWATTVAPVATAVLIKEWGIGAVAEGSLPHRQRITDGTGIPLDGGQTCHAQRNHNVDAVRLFILTNSPTSRPFKGDGAGNSKSNLLIGVAQQITPLNQIKQILAGLSQIANSLWIFDHRQTFAGQPLRRCDHLIWVVPNTTDIKSFTPVQKRLLDHTSILSILSLLGRL